MSREGMYDEIMEFIGDIPEEIAKAIEGIYKPKEPEILEGIYKPKESEIIEEAKKDVREKIIERGREIPSDEVIKQLAFDLIRGNFKQVIEAIEGLPKKGEAVLEQRRTIPILIPFIIIVAIIGYIIYR